VSLIENPLEALKPRNKPYKLADERGLYGEVAPTRRKLWRNRFHIGKGGKTFFDRYLPRSQPETSPPDGNQSADRDCQSLHHCQPAPERDLTVTDPRTAQTARRARQARDSQEMQTCAQAHIVDHAAAHRIYRYRRIGHAVVAWKKAGLCNQTFSSLGHFSQ
jgi:hypothetical protein